MGAKLKYAFVALALALVFILSILSYHLIVESRFKNADLLLATFSVRPTTGNKLVFAFQLVDNNRRGPYVSDGSEGRYFREVMIISYTINKPYPHVQSGYVYYFDGTDIYQVSGSIGWRFLNWSLYWGSRVYEEAVTVASLSSESDKIFDATESFRAVDRGRRVGPLTPVNVVVFFAITSVCFIFSIRQRSKKMSQVQKDS